MKDRISITMLEGGIADVRLIRADKMNALDAAMWEALAQAIDQLKATAGLRRADGTTYPARPSVFRRLPGFVRFSNLTSAPLRHLVASKARSHLL